MGDDEAVAVFPLRGRYLLFPGDRPHGVLHADKEKHADRITLLVNWWRERPASLADSDRCRPPGHESLDAVDSADCAGGRELQPARPTAAEPCPLSRIVGRPISAAFSAHAEEWRAQRVPVDLRW